MRLGLDKNEFFTLTPRMFEAMCRQKREEGRELQAQIALLRKDVINFSFCRPEKRVELADLLPAEAQKAAESPAARPVKMNSKRRAVVADQVRRNMALLMGQ